MPYRIDLRVSSADAFDRLVELGALDVEIIGDGIAAIMPDRIGADDVARALGHPPSRNASADHRPDVRVTPARGRDDESVWVLSPRPVRAGRLHIVPADGPLHAGALRLLDHAVFGSGLHPTTSLCLDALDQELSAWQPARVLDVGTGSGILALAALQLGVPSATAIDIDADAIRAAADNARLNDLSARLEVVHGGPEAVSGSWPLVLANILAAPLIDMAPSLAPRVSHSGRLIVSGIRASLARDVERAYVRVGMQLVHAQTRDGWTALTLHASW